MAWDRNPKDLTQEEEHELLTPETARGGADGADTDIGLITKFKLGSNSYQSTAQIIVWTFVSLTTLLVIFAATAVISSLASKRKAQFHISNIMPSVNLATGPCEQLKYVNWMLHLLINGVATVIIACSNYMQQICTSPNFDEIKYEMKKYKDVPFGANSPTALFRRRQGSVILIWTLFVITSLPIHLFMNGVSGFAIQTFPVTGQVLDTNNGPSNGTVLPTDCANFLANAENWVTEFENMTIIVKNSTYVPKYQAFVDGWNAGSRETEGPPSPNELSSCLVTTAVPQCSITIRWFPLVVTSIAMLIKSLTAFLAIRKSQHFKHRLYNSLGDFIAVATRHREELAVPGECLANKGEWKKTSARALRGGAGIPRRASRGIRIWVQYLGILDWIVWIFWVASVALIGYLTQISLAQVEEKFKNADSQTITNIFDLFSVAGFGRPSLAFIVGNSNPVSGTTFDGTEPVGFPLQIALANSPQLWFSVGYLLWNNQITRIWGEHEWRSFENRRKLPRVSYGAPLPGTRNTRWLQLPYSMSIVLMAVSTLMHWIVSQTLFVVEVENKSGLPRTDNAAAPFGLVYIICYSPTAIFVTACLAGLLILGITIYYLFPFRSFMPFMAGSARVVFASCTALPKDLPADGIMWGDVSDQWGRLAGFGENARSIKKGEIYPERNNRPSPAVQRYHSPSRNNFTPSVQETSSYRDTPSSSHINRRVSDAETLENFDFTPKEGELRYPENASTYAQPEYLTSQRPAGLQPLRIPQTRLRPQTSSTMASQLQRNTSSSSRNLPSPQTRRPRDQTNFGSGYNSSTWSTNRNTLHGVTEVESPSRGNSHEEEREWQSWGVYPGRAREQDSESEDDGPAQEVEWKGWGVNPN